MVLNNVKIITYNYKRQKYINNSIIISRNLIILDVNKMWNFLKKETCFNLYNFKK